MKNLKLIIPLGIMIVCVLVFFYSEPKPQVGEPISGKQLLSGVIFIFALTFLLFFNYNKWTGYGD